jgi:hypothetical protein
MSSKKKQSLDLDAMESELSGSAFFHQTTSTQVDKTTSSQVVKPEKPQVEKYTTHLKGTTIKAVKRWAFEHEMKDYEIVQLALDEFLERHKED